MKITISNCSDTIAACQRIERIYEMAIATWLGLEYEGYANKFRVKRPYYVGSKVEIQPAYGGSFYVAINVLDHASGKHPGTKPGIWKQSYAAALNTRDSLIAILDDLPRLDFQIGNDTVSATLPEFLCANTMCF